MGSGIVIQKTMLLAFAGLIISALIGSYLVFGNNSSTKNAVKPSEDTQENGNYQEIYIKALGTGTYDKPEVTVKKGIPVRLHFSAEQSAGCGKVMVMRDFGIQLISRSGEEQTAVFTPEQEGTYEYSCSMRMFIGKMKVVA